MTLTEVIARITARGMQVTEDKVSGNVHLLTVSKDGVNIPWPTITVSSKGGVSDVGLPSFHGGKVTGLGDYPTAAIYADVYLAHAGRPAQAEKALAALLQPVTQQVI